MILHLELLLFDLKFFKVYSLIEMITLYFSLRKISYSASMFCKGKVYSH